MNIIWLIGIGSGLGGICRYGLSTASYKWLGQSFPIGTLVVNGLGSFVIGFLFVIFLERYHNFAYQLRSLLIVGFLGGFTTFSSFSLETMNLITRGEILKATANVFISIIICLSLTWCGMLLGRIG